MLPDYFNRIRLNYFYFNHYPFPVESFAHKSTFVEHPIAELPAHKFEIIPPYELEDDPIRRLIGLDARFVAFNFVIDHAR